MNSTNNLSARESLVVARDMFFNALRDKFQPGPIGDQQCREWVNGLVLTQGEVRLEVELQANTNELKFGVTPNQSNTTNVVFNTELRLPLQDSICATEMYLYVGKPASRTATNWSLRTYGNTQDFSAAAATAIDTQLYSHGIFRMTVNNRVIVPQRGLANFHYRGQTQQTAPLGAGSPGDMFRGSDDAGVTCEPNIVLIGSANNIPTIVLPAALGTVDEFSRAILVFKGPYAQNSTVVN